MYDTLSPWQQAIQNMKLIKNGLVGIDRALDQMSFRIYPYKTLTYIPRKFIKWSYLLLSYLRSVVREQVRF